MTEQQTANLTKVGVTFTSDKNVAGRRIFKGGLLLPCLPKGVETEAEIAHLISHTLLLGEVTNVKIVYKTSEQGVRYQSAYVDILYWFNTYPAMLVQKQLTDSLQTKQGVSVSDEYMFNGCELSDWTTEFVAYELLDDQNNVTGFELAGCPVGKHDFRFKNGKPMTHLMIRPVKVGITCEGGALDLESRFKDGDESAGDTSRWSSLYIPFLPKNMVEFATEESDGDVDHRNTILDDILTGLFENYSPIGRVSRIDYADIMKKNDGNDEASPTGNLRAFVHFYEWWNTTPAMLIRNGVESSAKQWQIRNHKDQYDNEYGFIVVKKAVKPLAEAPQVVVEETVDSESLPKEEQFAMETD